MKEIMRERAATHNKVFLQLARLGLKGVRGVEVVHVVVSGLAAEDIARLFSQCVLVKRPEREHGWGRALSICCFLTPRL
jgi:hypothetical protein